MLIRVKLMASLRNRLPAGAVGGAAEVQLPETATLADALKQLGIALGHVHLTMVNGARETNLERPLADGDEIVAFPPVAGG